jgi:hypothetical protein
VPFLRLDAFEETDDRRPDKTPMSRRTWTVCLTGTITSTCLNVTTGDMERPGCLREEAGEEAFECELLRRLGTALTIWSQLQEQGSWLRYQAYLHRMLLLTGTPMSECRRRSGCSWQGWNGGMEKETARMRSIYTKNEHTQTVDLLARSLRIIQRPNRACAVGEAVRRLVST